MERTWRERVAEIIVQPEFALLGTGIEALCEEASSAALEEAAKIAEHHADGTHEVWREQRVAWGDSIAAGIRALKEADDG